MERTITQGKSVDAPLTLNNVMSKIRKLFIEVKMGFGQDKKAQKDYVSNITCPTYSELYEEVDPLEREEDGDTFNDD